MADTWNTRSQIVQQEDPNAQRYRTSDDPEVPDVVHRGGSRTRLQDDNHQSHLDRRAAEARALQDALTTTDREAFDPAKHGLRPLEPHRQTRR